MSVGVDQKVLNRFEKEQCRNRNIRFKYYTNLLMTAEEIKAGPTLMTQLSQKDFHCEFSGAEENNGEMHDH